jgi:hypothetical protein
LTNKSQNFLNSNPSGAFPTKRCEHAWLPVCQRKIIHEPVNALPYIKPGGGGLMQLVITFQVWLQSVSLRVSTARLGQEYSEGETHFAEKPVPESVKK